MTDGHRVDVSDGHVIPECLKDRDIWVVWSPALGKTPRAPWQEGHMYPCQWAADKADPRVSFETAADVALKNIEEIDARWPFPPDAEPDTVKPAVLLPPREYSLMFADLDDVITGGRITAEAWDILDRLGGYAEVSRSFFDAEEPTSGVHAWVRADLPGGRKKIITPLDDAGQLELYTNQARMTGGTWRHIEGTSTDAVPDAQAVIDELLEEYADLDTDAPPDTPDSDRDRRDAELRTHSTRDKSPYYLLDTEAIADTGPFSRHGDGTQGPHPAHGGTSSKDSKSINFSLDGEEWYCFAHDDGGGPLDLIATLEGTASCGETWKVHREPTTLLKTCLAARDKYAPAALDGEAPPYAALVEIAERHDLEMADAEEGILGRATYTFALEIYRHMEY